MTAGEQGRSAIQGPVGQNESGAAISGRDLRFVAIWAVSILLLYAIGSYFAVRQLQGYKAETQRIRRARIRAAAASSAGASRQAAATPTKVTVGIYVYRIGQFSLREGIWAADFDIWFRWTGNKLSPGDTFQIVNGEIDSRERKEAYSSARERYERYHVNAHFTQYIDASRFPFSDEALIIEVEDGIHGAATLRYVADKRSSGFSSSAIPPALHITRSLAGVNQSVYRSSLGDPRMTAGVAADAYSRYVFAMLARPHGGWVFVGMFQALFAAVLIALLAAFIRPIYGDGRFGLGIGAFFAAVGNNVFVASMIPPPSRLTLTAMVNGIGLATIALTLIQSIISLQVYGMGKEKLSVLFDKVSFVVLLVGYATISLLLPLTAR